MKSIDGPWIIQHSWSWFGFQVTLLSPRLHAVANIPSCLQVGIIISSSELLHLFMCNSGDGRVFSYGTNAHGQVSCLEAWRSWILIRFSISAGMARERTAANRCLLYLWIMLCGWPVATIILFAFAVMVLYLHLGRYCIPLCKNAVSKSLSLYG